MIEQMVDMTWKAILIRKFEYCEPGVTQLSRTYLHAAHTAQTKHIILIAFRLATPHKEEAQSHLNNLTDEVA